MPAHVFPVFDVEIIRWIADLWGSSSSVLGKKRA
jgi:hypothetical protein